MPKPDREPAPARPDRFWAGMVRIVLALFSVVALPILFPAATAYLQVLLAYLVGTILFQIAIHKNVWGAGRQLLGGLMDLALVTFVAHRMGSLSTPFVAAYSLVGMFYALVAPVWAAVTLTTFGLVAYAATCYAEAYRLIQYAPDRPEFAVFQPTIEAATGHVLVLSAFVSASTWVAYRITRVLHRREEQLHAANIKLEELSQRDPLTKLYNRRYLVTRAEAELARTRRGHSMALIMMDLDGFKRVNDDAGHLAGDELLCRLAREILATAREVDIVARFGGDEFVAILTDTDADGAVAVAERMQRAIRDAGRAAVPGHDVTASIGIAAAQPGDDVATLISAADEAAYQAKRDGGDRYHQARADATSSMA